MSALHIRGCSAAIPGADNAWQDELPAHIKRRDPRIWTMAYAATARLLKTISEKPRSVCVGTGLGALDETKNFLDGLFKDGFGSPRNFIASVHNSMAGKLALEFSIDGPNLTMCDGQNSLASAIALCGLLPDNAFPCLVVAVDEAIPLLQELAPHLSIDCQTRTAGMGEEGAVALLLDRNSPSGLPAIRAVAPTPVGPHTPEACAAVLAESFGARAATVRPLGDCRSFLSAALQVHATLGSARPGTFIVPSYSPSSMACAAIEVTV